MGLPAGFDPVKGTWSGVSAPKIQSNYNTISSGSYSGSYSTYSSRNYNLWDRFNDAIKSIGNWIDDIIEPVSGWITILGIIIGAIGLIVGDLLYDHGCFLFVDQSDGLCNKFLWVVFKHGKGVWPDACQNLCSRTTR